MPSTRVGPAAIVVQVLVVRVLAPLARAAQPVDGALRRPPKREEEDGEDIAEPAA